MHEMLHFSIEPVASNLASLALRNDGCETVSGHARVMAGSCSNRPSIVVRVFTCFLKCRFVNLHVQISWQVQRFVNFEVQMSWQALHFVNLHVQISWQAQHFVNLEVQISRQAQHFVKLHVLISWQAQHFVNLHVQISWQAQYKMRFREIADARNDALFNRAAGSEPGKSSSAERRLRDGLGSCSGHGRVTLESSLHCG